MARPACRQAGRSPYRGSCQSAAAGNFGNCKPCREGVWEIRIAWGAGYRVYYARVGRAVILLLCGGDKQTQDSDIDEAIGYLKEFKRRPS